LSNRLPASVTNRLPAEGINSSSEHPLREAAWLVLATLVTLAALVWALGLGARWLAPRVPFAVEVALAERWVDPLLAARVPAPATPDEAARLAAREAALQALAARVAAVMDLPPGMTLVVGLDPSLQLNAFATLGGRVRVFQGLLDALDSEDALAALLAHEIAHVRERHVAANAGRGLALTLALGLLSADAGAAAARAVLGQATQLALLSYSRDQEAEADSAALAAVVALYGHGGGVQALFQTLGRSMADRPGGEGPALLRSHPKTAERLSALRQQAVARDWAPDGPLSPLPVALVDGRADRSR
jgi:Zn-dependent protease with chaperone function